MTERRRLESSQIFFGVHILFSRRALRKHTKSHLHHDQDSNEGRRRRGTEREEVKHTEISGCECVENHKKFLIFTRLGRSRLSSSVNRLVPAPISDRTHVTSMLCQHAIHQHCFRWVSQFLSHSLCDKFISDNKKKNLLTSKSSSDNNNIIRIFSVLWWQACRERARA